MANRYTDVDLLILKRWDEVQALRKAFDDLLSRMQGVVEASLKKVATAALEKGYSSAFDARRPSIWFWKPDWETRRKKEPAIYLWLADFVPTDYSRDVEDHPSMWLITEDISKLKLSQSSEDFGRAVRAALPQELLAKWDHEDANISEAPLGRDCTDVTEAERVSLVGEPEALSKFVISRLEEFTELIPALDQVIEKLTPDSRAA